MADQDAYRRYTTGAELCLAQIETLDTGQADVAQAYATAAGAWATLALAAAQDRVMPADRPTEDSAATVGYIVVHDEMVKPTEAASSRDVVMADDRGRRWRAAIGPEGPRWEAVPHG